jgi:hypothetical protein
MAYYYNLPQQTHHPNPNAAPQHNHHGRSRRGPRLQAQGAHRPFRGVRSMKELTDAPVYSAFRARFEACKGFDLDDDLEFCPGLLTEDDVRLTSSAHSPQANTSQLQSVSSMSDRSSNSSGSPSASPLQHQVHPQQQVSPPFTLAPSFQPAPAFSAQPATHKILQPTAVRSHKAIPIVNPSTGMRVASPPNSVSPGRMQQQTYRRW